MKKIIAFLIIISLTGTVFAQRRKNTPKPEANATTVKKDTLPNRTVTVTSAFQPSLKSTSKINFSAASPLPDSARPQLEYDVPAQNLFFSYQSPALKPLAANIDSNIHWENRSYIKLGYGNFTTPYAQAAFSFGDGAKSIVNVKGLYTSSKSSVPFQQFSKTELDAIGLFASPGNKNEWNGKLFYKNSTQYQYGFLPDSLKFSKDELRQGFTTFGGTVGVRNKTENTAGINYHPNVSLSLFRDDDGSNESNFKIEAPMVKSFGKIFGFGLGLTADITTYKSDSAGEITNNLYYVTPAILFKTPNFNITGGFSPSWDNQVFSMLPNFSAEAKINEEKFILLAGWMGYFNKTTYQSLASVNPWLQQPKFLLNTKIQEQYAGFKGSAGAHVTYNAKVSYLKFNNQPLFINDTVTGKSFRVINESEMKAVRIHGEIGYTLQEKLSLLAGATFNQYSSLKNNEKAWGLVPLEVNAALRWQVLKDFLVKTDVFFWDGAQYPNKLMQVRKLDPALDVNAGVEFSIMPQLNAWVQFNNIFNNKYQRWNQYPVFGFNVMAGVVFNFGELKTK